MSTPHNFINKQDTENFFRKYFSVLNLDSEQIIGGNDPDSGYTIVSPADYSGLYELDTDSTSVSFQTREQSYEEILIKNYEIFYSLKADEPSNLSTSKDVNISFGYRGGFTSLPFNCFTYTRNINTSAVTTFRSQTFDQIRVHNSGTNAGYLSNSLTEPFCKLYIFSDFDSAQYNTFYYGHSFTYTTSSPASRTDYLINIHYGYSNYLANNTKNIKSLNLTHADGQDILTGSRFMFYAYQ